MKKKIVLLSIVLLLPVVFVFFSKYYMSDMSTKIDEKIYKIDYSNDLKLQGKILSEKTQNILLNENLGKIEKIDVSNGQKVSVGDLILVYTNPNVEEELSALEFSISRRTIVIENLENDILNYQTELAKLSKKPNAENAVDISAKKKEISKATEQLQLEQINLSEEYAKVDRIREKQQTSVFSELDGLVFLNENNSEKNNSIMIYSNKKNVTLNISDVDYEKINTGDEVSFKKNNDDNKLYKGKVTFKSTIPNVDDSNDLGQSSKYTVKIDFSDTDLKDGDRVFVLIKDKEIKIPVSAIKDGYVLKKIKSGDFEKTQIEFIEKDGYMILKTGLEIGDEIKEVYSDD